ncbi:hypothetical protein IY974_01970 [Campylobacter volucris]|uniref:toxin-antitoxin system YwqK family antitoxin n=1 Tax=Campylobacter volucris TaxID=1031542 RepID=UPI00189CD258|nr:hypothetical protein [Campylobacter volucris]MBF7045323.1 hypothetical protein [Campylobacter volucris]
MKNLFFGALIIGSILVGCKEENPNQSSGGAVEGILNQPSGVARVATSYLNNGVKIETPINSNNKIHGIKRAYYSNGIISSEISYKDGLRDGIAKEYFNNGTLKKEMVYKNDKIISIKTYHKNGNLNFEVFCSEDEKIDGLFKVNGVLKVYNDDGSLEAEGIFTNGVGTKIIKNGINKGQTFTYTSKNPLTCYKFF